MVRLRALHLVVGVAGFIAFLLTGQYMRWVHAGLDGMADGPRLFFRSAHIFLLWSSLLNIVLGCYLTPVASVVARRVQRASSLLILIGPLLLGVSFFFESYTPALTRPVSNLAHFLTLGGIAGHGAALIFAHFAVRAAQARTADEAVDARTPHAR